MEIRHDVDLTSFSKLRLKSKGSLILIESREELAKAILDNNFTPVGDGFNIVLAPQPEKPLLKFKQSNLIFDGLRVLASSDLRLKPFINKLNAQGIHHMDFLKVIPGTVGGALFMNAGTKVGEIKEFVESVTVMCRKSGEIRTLSNDECVFQYRNSIFQEGEHYILEALFNFEDKVVKEQNSKRTVNRIQYPNCGSIFKNPPGHKAGILIDQCGLKGTERNGLVISHDHANVIINTAKTASLPDFLELVELIQSEVKKKHQVDLELEVRIIQ